MKGISPLIATVIIVAVTIVAAILVTSSTISVLKTSTDTTTTTKKCPSAALELLDYRCVNSSASYDTIRVAVTNVGSVALSNFSIFALVDTSVYNNATPDNGATVLSPGASTTFSATTTLNGTISKLRVISGGDCPGIYIEVTNDTKAIGSCSMV